jgi:hypothetical protein
MTGLLDIARQAEQAQLARDASMSRHGLLNDDTPLQRAQYGGMYGSLMQDPADKSRMERQMMEDTMAMMPIAGMTTYHGSPHIFNKFRMDKMGTGEGAQAYGHGLYLAENPNVAKIYSNPEQSYARFSGHLNNREEFIKDMMDQGRSKDDVWNMAREKYGEFIDHKTLKQDFDSVVELGFEKANLYKVDLPDDQIKNMLDWDAPLSKQPEGVKKQIKNLFDDDYIEHLVEESGYQWNGDLSALTGKELYQLFKKAGRDDFMPPLPIEATRSLGNAERASEFLKSKGIPGIKYLDQGSRGAGQGTRNFVVFDENIPQILERNQQPMGGLLGK